MSENLRGDFLTYTVFLVEGDVSAGDDVVSIKSVVFARWRH